MWDHFGVGGSVNETTRTIADDINTLTKDVGQFGSALHSIDGRCRRCLQGPRPGGGRSAIATITAANEDFAGRAEVRSLRQRAESFGRCRRIDQRPEAREQPRDGKHQTRIRNARQRSQFLMTDVDVQLHDDVLGESDPPAPPPKLKSPIPAG